MAVNLSRSSALLRAINYPPSMSVPRNSPVVIRAGRKTIQLAHGQLRTGSVLRCCAIVGEAAEEIKEDDRDSFDDESPAASPKKEQVIFLIPDFFLKHFL